MTREPSSLMSEIERDLLDGRPVEDVLRKLIILGGLARSSALRDWASLELRGYGEVPVDELPSYRKVLGLIQLDAIVGRGSVAHQTIGANELPEGIREHITNHVPLWQGIGEVQALIDHHASGEAVRFGLPDERVIARLMDRASQDAFQRVTAIYWSVSVSSLSGVVDQVRTRLAELLGELRASTPDGLTPAAADVAAAVNVVVRGKGNRVTVAQAGRAESVLVGAHADGETGFWTAGKKVGAFLVGLASITGVVITWLQWSGA